MPKVFSRATLEKFEAASASIPLRQIDRAFEAANIRLAADPGGPDGARRVQFRRYVAGVDQNDPLQQDRLSDVLGALIEEVADSKKDFLVKAAEGDGFLFADGAFRQAPTAPSSFAVTRIEDLASIDDRGRRLRLLANESPAEAISGARTLVESVCQTVLLPAGTGDAKKSITLVNKCLQQLRAVVATLGELQTVSPRHARLAVGAAVSFATFVAETYVEQAIPNRS